MYNKRSVFWAACFGMLLFGIGLITLGSIASDLKSKFNLSEKAIGQIFSVLAAGILIGSLLFGPICDRSGYKNILVIACFGMTAGFEGIAFLTSTGLLKICIFTFGFSAGIINGATNAVVSDISKESKGANLSLLGVFFGIGALAMPFVLAVLEDQFTGFDIVAIMGVLTLLAAIFYSLLKFPRSKRELGFPLTETKILFRQGYLYLIAFFLFFQGGLESVLNNWTTLFFMQQKISESNSLFALSFYVAGMIVMRLLIGSIFRNWSFVKLMSVSLAIIFLGIVLINLSQSFYMSVAGLILLGFGLAAGFPAMLGMAGERYPPQSATAFSIIFTIALVGNILVNGVMGYIAKNNGMHNYTSVVFAEFVLMLVFAFLIFKHRSGRS